MTKHLRFFMLALLTVVFGTAWGGSITFADLGLENGVQYTDPFDGGDFTVTFSGGANDGKYYTTGSGIRVYGNGSMTVAAKSGNLSQITITFSGAYKPETADVVDNGTYDPETGVWTGSAASVVFTRPAGSGHWRIQKVEAVVGGASPTLSINGTTPFVESTQVTITPSNSDFAVYYSTDGSDPGTNPIVYTGPFTITETTTVKAVEEDLEGNLSAVVEKTFVKQELNVQTVADIAAFKALEDGTEANLKLTNAQVLYAGTSDIYVRDASGAIDFYNTGLKLTTGQMLNGSVIGKRATYNNIPELVKSDNTNSNAITATNGTATPIVLTVAQAKDEQYYCNLIRIEGVKVVAKQEGNYTNYYAYVGNDSIMIYDRFKVGLGDWNENDTYNLEGILVPYKGAFEVYITQSLAGGTTPPDPGVTVCDNIAAFKALSSGTEAELKLDNAKVLYAKDRDVYVRDASGAIEFYNLGINFETDQVLNGSIIGKYSPYNNLPEIAKT
ncbi:MAG: chitobiase/beta-hexosaminidase C-terminal domain-containing protein, partial [Prevotella sp.]|nr:chitobiase/beta-hexosaminidase C-terminal domain-containing protein [Prevotella sp.]